MLIAEAPPLKLILYTEGEVLQEITNLTADKYQELLLTDQLPDEPGQAAPPSETEQRLPSQPVFPAVSWASAQLEDATSRSLNLPNRGTTSNLEDHLAPHGLSHRAVSGIFICGGHPYWGDGHQHQVHSPKGSFVFYRALCNTYGWECMTSGALI